MAAPAATTATPPFASRQLVDIRRRTPRTPAPQPRSSTATSVSRKNPRQMNIRASTARSSHGWEASQPPWSGKLIAIPPPSAAVEVVRQPECHAGPEVHDNHAQDDDQHVGHHAGEDLVQ